MFSPVGAAAVAESGLSMSASNRIPAGMELLKRYRLFTRYVCSFAQEVWPEVDLKLIAEAGVTKQA